ncbi:MAG: hypothetical protein ACRBBW_09430 [Cellvibrionaceae bacterium]
MSNQDSFDQWLDSAMKNQADYIDDDGFSEQVLAELPHRPKLASWQQNLIIIVSALIGCAVAALNVPTMWVDALLNVTTIPWITAVAMGGGMLLVGGAIVWNDRERWI